ncbi:MAG TPA: hypothetical protein DEP07_12115 [Brevibacillus sp.]|nr:hypothetical protein EDM60_09630 [Brevibacillus parabrevis]HBZ81113.1 hypothetical protein [Brevibacillus sp.]
MQKQSLNRTTFGKGEEHGNKVDVLSREYLSITNSGTNITKSQEDKYSYCKYRYSFLFVNWQYLNLYSQKWCSFENGSDWWIGLALNV